MQKCPIYLYTNSFEVLLDLDDNTRVHNIMYQHDLKVQKGLKNKIQLQFKNSDQKRVNVSTGTFVFSMFDQNEQRQLIQKPLSLIDDGTTSTRGLALLELSESDTLDLATGFYKFTVSSMDSDGSYMPTYANTYYGVGGTLEVRQDSLPVLIPSQSVEEFQHQYNNDTQLWEFYSGNLRAFPEFNGNTALHTVALYLNNFKGTIYIEATQENSPGYFGNYATVSTISKTQNTTGIVYANFNGVFSYVRVRYVPDADGYSINFYTAGMGGNPLGNVDYYPNGKIDKLLYRS